MSAAVQQQRPIEPVTAESGGPTSVPSNIEAAADLPPIANGEAKRSDPVLASSEGSANGPISAASVQGASLSASDVTREGRKDASDSTTALITEREQAADGASITIRSDNNPAPPAAPSSPRRPPTTPDAPPPPTSSTPAPAPVTSAAGPGPATSSTPPLDFLPPLTSITASIAAAPPPRQGEFSYNPSDYSARPDPSEIDVEAMNRRDDEDEDAPGSPTGRLLKLLAPQQALLADHRWGAPPHNASVNLFIGRALLSNGNDNWPLKPNEIVGWIRRHYPSEWDGDEGRCSAHRVRTYLARKGTDMYYERLTQGPVSGWRIRANHLWRFENGGFQGRGMKQEDAIAMQIKEEEKAITDKHRMKAAEALKAGHPGMGRKFGGLSSPSTTNPSTAKTGARTPRVSVSGASRQIRKTPSVTPIPSPAPHRASSVTHSVPATNTQTSSQSATPVQQAAPTGQPSHSNVSRPSSPPHHVAPPPSSVPLVRRAEPTSEPAAKRVRLKAGPAAQLTGTLNKQAKISRSDVAAAILRIQQEAKDEAAAQAAAEAAMQHLQGMGITMDMHALGMGVDFGGYDGYGNGYQQDGHGHNTDWAGYDLHNQTGLDMDNSGLGTTMTNASGHEYEEDAMDLEMVQAAMQAAAAAAGVVGYGGLGMLDPEWQHEQQHQDQTGSGTMALDGSFDLAHPHESMSISNGQSSGLDELGLGMNMGMEIPIEMQMRQGESDSHTHSDTANHQHQAQQQQSHHSHNQHQHHHQQQHQTTSDSSGTAYPEMNQDDLNMINMISMQYGPELDMNMGMNLNMDMDMNLGINMLDGMGMGPLDGMGGLGGLDDMMGHYGATHGGGQSEGHGHTHAHAHEHNHVHGQGHRGAAGDDTGASG